MGGEGIPTTAASLRISAHCVFFFFIVLGFNNTSTPVGHFVSSPRERIVEEMKRGKGKKEEQE